MEEDEPKGREDSEKEEEVEEEEEEEEEENANDEVSFQWTPAAQLALIESQTRDINRGAWHRVIEILHSSHNYSGRNNKTNQKSVNSYFRSLMNNLGERDYKMTQFRAPKGSKLTKDQRIQQEAAHNIIQAQKSANWKEMQKMRDIIIGKEVRKDSNNKSKKGKELLDEMEMRGKSQKKDREEIADKLEKMKQKDEEKRSSILNAITNATEVIKQSMEFEKKAFDRYELLMERFEKMILSMEESNQHDINHEIAPQKKRKGSISYEKRR
eukprot:TRINITY_DN4122_c0_g1_i1.p1 TRINITY_DN4122_c0_g1~~TRINITY_DN4122_c0_g1_i1.p1  ORF type:complete len:269 (-),score=100.76 TRINITY_DN4122_c0_g1_i1:358-1164(-)